MKEEKNCKRKNLTIFSIIGIILLLASALTILPDARANNLAKTDYSFFLDRIDAGAVTKAEIGDSAVIFETIEPDGSAKRYSTPKLDDPELVSRLRQNGNIEFSGNSAASSPLKRPLSSWLIASVLIVVIWGAAIKSASKRTLGASSLGKTSARIFNKEHTGKTFADVAGQDEAKEALAEIVGFLHTPEKYTEIGARLPKGALLEGPPGTGKTLLAQAVAGEADVPFFSVSGSEFVELFVGMGAAKIRDFFKQANEKAPCIVFIDEIDAIGKKRDGTSIGNDEREQTLNQLLTEMDGFDGKKGIVVLASTNRPDVLDPALLRPGRFDRHIPVELPDISGREAILKVHAKNIKTEDGIDFNAIARSAAGASGANLANIVNESALRAVRSGRCTVTQADLEASIETVIAGYERKNAVISQREKELIAYHEIGHALVAAMQKNSAPVHKITIIPRTSGALGYTMQVDEEEKMLMTADEAHAKLAVLAGGRSAEELVFGVCTSGASNDIEKATKLARAMVTRLGMSPHFGMVALEASGSKYLDGDASLACAQGTAERIDREVCDIIKKAHNTALSILSENVGKLHRLAKFLLEKETITGEEFMAILAEE